MKEFFVIPISASSSNTFKLFSLEALEVTQIHVYDYFIFNHPSADSVAIQNLFTIQNNENYEEL